MANLFNRAGHASATAGTGTITLGAALGAVAPNLCSFESFANAGVADQTLLSYLILDSNGGWETGWGIYTASGTTLTRNVTRSSNSNNPLNLSGNEQVFITARAEDIATVVQCGQLQLASATQIKFVPFGGNQVKIAGNLYTIPSAGVTANNTSVFVNGVAGQNLAVSTVYYVYLFNNSGTLTVDFSTTGHATDTTSGNAGVEIKSGDNSRSLVGMIRTNGSSQFSDNNTSRLLLSWFNRQLKDGLLGTGNANTTTSTGANVVMTATFPMLNWGNEATFALWNAQGALTGGGGGFSQAGVGADGVNIICIQFIYAAFPNPVPAAIGGWLTQSEGYHTYAGIGGGNSSANGNTLTMFNGTLSLVTRG